MAHILSYGSLNLDLVYQVPHFVQAGETLSSTSRTVHCGGKGLNQSIAAARAGGTVSHAGKIGGDGTVLTDILRESGVDTDFVTVGDGPSGHAVIQVDPSGQNCILLFGGCNQEITHEEIDRVLGQTAEGENLSDSFLMEHSEINPDEEYSDTDEYEDGPSFNADDIYGDSDSDSDSDGGDED